jgi:MEMO1 family protein
MEAGKGCPKLRNIDIFPAEVSGQRVICLRDPLNLSGKMLFVPGPALFLIGLLDGAHSIRDIQSEYVRRFGELLYSEKIQELIDRLDEHFLLESDRFRERDRKIRADFQNSPIRPMVLAGESYEEEPSRLKEEIRAYFRGPGGPGDPRANGSTARLAAVISPHIDFRRGGTCYAFAHKAICEAAEADLFLILGTAHAPTRAPFVLTRKHFETPWGIVETDRDFLAGFERECPLDFYDDEFLHKTEHSIELQLVFLRALRAPERPFRIVPVLCGSFHEAVQRDISPLRLPGVGEFLAALRAAIAASPRRICILASADLAHVGIRFGDPEPPDAKTLRFLDEEDRRMLERVRTLDPEGFFAFLRREEDRRKVCGSSAIYSLLSLIESGPGELLNYGQAVEENAQSVVTFASLAFYAARGGEAGRG